MTLVTDELHLLS